MKRRSAFTLVEMLMVVAILLVLLSLVLPTLGRAREGARQAACLANLRQLGTAMTSYLADNDRTFPRPAGGGPREEDWVWWEPSRDPDKWKGRIVRHLDPAENKAGGSWEAVLRCPSDDAVSHSRGRPYPYSYTVNESVCRTAPAAGLNLNHVKRPAEKILFIDEALATADDGRWQPQLFAADGRNALSGQHDRAGDAPADPRAGRGNVVFVDGHAEYVTRGTATDPRHWDAGLQ